MSDDVNELDVENDDFEVGSVPEARVVAERFHRKLKPWHKPRKQLVRRAWRDNVSRLMSDLTWPLGAERVLRYFTLPAPEMLDIRTLVGPAREKQYKVQYVGFTDARNGSQDDAQFRLAQNALRVQDDWVHSDSNILYYKLEELAHGTRPVAKAKLKDYGPFHVVNFDLCDYLLAPGDNAKLLESLAHILDIQTSRQKDDWLLFIATRFDAANTCPEKFAMLRQVIESNCAESAEFQTGLETLLKVAAGTFSQVLADPSAVNQEQLCAAISVGLTKWLATVLAKAVPPFQLDMMKSYVYAVEGSTQDMLSFVYRCRYRGTAAPANEAVIAAVGAKPNAAPLSTVESTVGYTKQSTAAPAPAPSLEVEAALKAIKKTSGLLDLDKQLRDYPNELISLGDETKALLREANYSEEVLAEYDAWARAEADKTEAPTS